MTTTENTPPPASPPMIQDHSATNWIKMWLTTSYAMCPPEIRERLVEQNSEIVLMYCTEEGDTLNALSLSDCQMLASLEVVDGIVAMTRREIALYEGGEK